MKVKQTAESQKADLSSASHPNQRTLGAVL